MQHLTYKSYLQIAIPFIVSIMTVPLLSAVDTAVIGHTNNNVLLGGVAVGSMVINTIFWLFGFLRISTTSQSAISMGAKDVNIKVRSLLQPSILALFFGVAIMILQKPIWYLIHSVVSADPEVSSVGELYFGILINATPIVLLNNVFIAWMMGQAQVRHTVAAQIIGNVSNIILDIIFVIGWGWGVAGIAIATVIAQCLSLFISLYWVTKALPKPFAPYLHLCFLNRTSISRIFKSNIYLFSRTICLLVFFNLFTRYGAQLGSDILATNAIMLQIIFLMSFLFDGLGNTTSIFAGQAVGQQNFKMLQRTKSITFGITSFFIILCLLLLGLFNQQIIFLFTTHPTILSLYNELKYWIFVFPVLAGFALTYYGIFTGTNTTEPVLYSTLIALVVFIAMHYMLPQTAHMLWLCYCFFFLGRLIFLLIFIRRVNNKITIGNQL